MKTIGKLKVRKRSYLVGFLTRLLLKLLAIKVAMVVVVSLGIVEFCDELLHFSHRVLGHRKGIWVKLLTDHDV